MSSCRFFKSKKHKKPQDCLVFDKKCQFCGKRDKELLSENLSALFTFDPLMGRRASLRFPSNFMRCIQCGSLDDKVVDSRSSKDGTSIRRRRECLNCGSRFTTYEQVERTELRVIKADGSREVINREKLFRGLVKACEKRKVSMDRIGRAVDEILSELHKDHQLEVPSRAIGAKVMDKLHAIDPVAYVRYVSVYRSFEDVGEFIREIQALENRSRSDVFQRKFFK